MAWSFVAWIVWSAVATPSLHAQRHGDSGQNYLKGIPDSTITVTVGNDKTQFRAADLAKLPTVIASASGSAHAVRGVLVTELLPATLSLSEADIFEIHYGFFRTRRLRNADLEPNSGIVITAQSDRGFSDRLSEFRVIATMRDGHAVVINHVAAIVLKPTQ
jgi:hypothetical protein